MDRNILDYGAKPDSTMLCTTAIQAAIDDCAKNGGGRVIIPPGTFVSGTIWLKSHVELHIAQGAVLKASTNMNDYNAEDAYEQNFGCPTPEQWVGKHLIIALECEDVAISGNGVIDGSGDFFYGEPKEIHDNFGWRYGLSMARDLEILRPGPLVCFVECKRVRVENATLRNMPCWGYLFHGCDFVNVHGVRVFNQRNYGNTDGIDIDSCSHVTVSDCIIDTGDDAITLRGDNAGLKQKGKVCEYVTITNCILGSYACGIRIGVGTGMIRHARISNITITNAANAICFMTDYCGHGHVSLEDIHFNGISATSIGRSIEMTANSSAHIRNVTIENFYVEAFAGAWMEANDLDKISGITIRNSLFKLIESPTPLNESLRAIRGEYLINAKNICNFTMENVRFEADAELMNDWEGTYNTVSCPGFHMQ